MRQSVRRIAFILLLVILGGLVGIALAGGEGEKLENFFIGGAVGAVLAILGVGLEIAVSGKGTMLIPSLIFGLVLGTFLAALVGGPIIVMLMQLYDRVISVEIAVLIFVGLVYLFTYLAIVVIMRTKDEFRFIIPFIEFRRESRHRTSLVVDTSALIDGRIVPLYKSGLIEDVIVVPRFVLRELQSVADSPDRSRRMRGRRGLDILKELQEIEGVVVRIHDARFPEVEDVDSKLVRLAQQMDQRLLTCDHNLEKVAGIQGLVVLNLHAVSEALRPPILPGDRITIEILREGDRPGQGVGFLEDGTMVVIDDGARERGKVVTAVVSNIRQGPVGRMVFAVIEGEGAAPAPRA